MESNDSTGSSLSGGQEGEQGQPKPGGSNLEKCSREELLSKCRNLLALAHKAKVAKDEATTELKKLKASHKNVDAISREADALREMVADLTEGKIVYSTKVESLQRQLKLTSSEIESQRVVEHDLIKERSQLISENSLLTEQKKSYQEKAEKEKLALEERVEKLEAQNGQVDVLKSKCKKLLEEKISVDEELQKQQKIVAKSIKLQGELKSLKEEKKADAIVLEAAKTEKKVLEEKLKNIESQVELLQKLKEDDDKNVKLDHTKTQELEEELSKYKSLLSDSDVSLKALQEKFAKLQQEQEDLQETFEANQKDRESADDKLNILKDELRSMSENKLQLEKQIEKLASENGGLTQSYTAQIDDLKSELLKINKEKQEELSISTQKFQEEKMQSVDKIKQLEADNVSFKDQINALQEQLKGNGEQNKQLNVKLEEKESEICDITEKLRSIEKENVNLVDRNRTFEEREKQIEKMKMELQTLSCEKTEISKRSENLETDVKVFREKLENEQKLRQNLESVISKYESETNMKLTEDVEHKERLNKLTSEISDLKSLNDELQEKVEQLENNVKASEFVLNELRCSGNSLLSLCRNLYPANQDVLPQDVENDPGQMLKSISDLLNLVASKKADCKYEMNLKSVTEELDKFRRQCQNIEMFSNDMEWNEHARCFEGLSNSLINFYGSVSLVMDVSNEENSLFEDKWRDVASVYNKFCENLKQEFVGINNLKKEFEELRQEKLRCEQQLAEASSEKDEFCKKLSDLQAKLRTTEERCIELENEMTSGDSEKEEIVKSLRQQLHTLGKEKDMLNESVRDIQTEKANLEICLNKQREEIETVCAERDSSFNEKKAVETEKEHLQSSFENLRSQSSTKEKCLLDEKQDLEKKLTMLSEEKINLEKEFASLNADKRSLEEDSDKEKKSTNERVKVLLEEQVLQQQEIEILKSENSKLQDNTIQLEKRIQELNSEVLQLQNALKSSEQTIQALKNEKDISEKNLKDVQNQNHQLQSAIEASSSRCEEVLSELNNMNKVLRERGERISRLEAANKDKSEQLEATKAQLRELESKMSSSEAELASKQEQLQTITEKLQSFGSDSTAIVSSNVSQEITIKLEQKVKELEQEKLALSKTIQGLESELQSGREVAGPCHDGQSEVMSTSTISRAEDCQRMKELEDTFEERYMKLKSVAIRLKKRVAELTAQLNSSEENRTKLVSEKEDLKKKVDGGSKDSSVKATSKNIQIMQGEIDRLQDEVDSGKKELKECGKQLNSAAEQLANVKSELAASQEENGTLLKTLKNQEENLTVQRDESASLRGQIVALEKRLAAEAEQQQVVEERRKKAEDQMEEERQKATQYARELGEAKQDMKNKSLMDLEMRDYELTVEELNNKLAEKDTKILELEADIVREKGRSCSLQDQLTHLTAQEATERERAEKMKKLLLEHKTQLAELRQVQEVQIAAHESDRVTIEELTQELEKQKLVMSEISIEKTKLENLVRNTKSTSERQIEVLEEELRKYKTEAGQLSTELDAIKKEFDGYKVRAASVLRQKARAPEVDVNELKGEKDQLQEDYEAVQLRIQQLQSELSALRAEHSFLQSEKEGIARQVSSLTDDLSRRETLHRERIANLERKSEGKISEYQLIIASMSSQNETMNSSFKKQLESMRQTHSREIEELTTKLEDAEDKLWQLKNSISTSVASTTNSSSTSSGLAAVHPLRTEPDQANNLHNHSSQHRRQPSSHGCEEPRIDVSNMVREEGEGSEWVEPIHQSPGRPGGYSPPPLEQLINSPLPSNVGLPPQEDTISIASLNTDATSKEIARLESKVTSGEMRIHQLTSLLHESEAENAKLAQLSDALKEEIRRSSRNESREKHMENMEYMKNIILKFLVTKNGEERKHMVPVLKTVLQLSPQETSDLEHLAVGGEEGGSNQGWGNYLHLWSSR